MSTQNTIQPNYNFRQNKLNYESAIINDTFFDEIEDFIFSTDEAKTSSQTLHNAEIKWLINKVVSWNMNIFMLIFYICYNLIK